MLTVRLLSHTSLMTHRTLRYYIISILSTLLLTFQDYMLYYFILYVVHLDHFAVGLHPSVVPFIHIYPLCFFLRDNLVCVRT